MKNCLLKTIIENGEDANTRLYQTSDRKRLLFEFFKGLRIFALRQIEGENGTVLDCSDGEPFDKLAESYGFKKNANGVFSMYENQEFFYHMRWFEV